MSDEVAKEFETQKSPQTPGTPEGKSVTMSVTLHPNGQIDFQLPAGNKILAYGLIEVARAQLDKMYLLSEMEKTVPPRGGVEGLLKRMNGGRG